MSTRGHVFDYETFRSPRMGDEDDLRPGQIQDLSNAINLTHAFLQKLRRLDLMADLIRKSAMAYSQSKDVERANLDLINRIAAHGNDLPRHRVLVLEFARALHASASWRT